MSLKNRVWTSPLRKLVLSYQAYWHVGAPIRCSGKGNGVITASLQIFGHQNLTLLVHNTVLGNKALWGLGMRVWEWEFGYESLGTRLRGVWEWESGYESLGTRLRGVWEWESMYEAQVVWVWEFGNEAPWSLEMRVWVWEFGNEAPWGLGMRVWVWGSSGLYSMSFNLRN